MKGLEELEELKKDYTINGHMDIMDEYRFTIIEKELKAKEKLEYKVQKLKAEKKGLMAVLDAYKKDSKALEIICAVVNHSKFTLELLLQNGVIDKEEFDLLKEVLKNE